jgi:uncharacterized metal-binding protein YceD (DUF177 family)
MGKFTEYKLPLKSMPVGVEQFEYRLGKQFFVNMEDNDVRNADILVKLTVEHKNDCYDMQFAVTGTVTVACDRCLDDLDLPVDTTYHIIVKYGDDYSEYNDFLQIPESDSYLNVAYMIHDTVALAIPIKHVHPMGKCNRAMSALLKKHRATDGDDEEDALIQEQLIDEMERMANDDITTTDARWDKLKDFNPEA